MSILINEFVKLYEGRELAKLRIQYKDYVAWQKNIINSEKLKHQEKYWLEKFTGELPVLNLPYDYPRPSIQNFEGDNISFEIKKEEVQKFRELLKERGSTLNMGLLAVYNILLSRYSGQEDIVVGSPTAGRLHSDLDNILGIFVNTLSLRNKPEGAKTFTAFLEEVKQETIKSFENQSYQFEELVEKVAHTRDISRNPLFDVMFVLQNVEMGELAIEGLTFKPYQKEALVSKFDLTLNAFERKDEIYFVIEYCTKLFNRESIERMISHFKQILEVVTTTPGIQLKDIDIF